MKFSSHRIASFEGPKTTRPVSLEGGEEESEGTDLSM
jgi:hypothetical protein